jgi:hypothetical protein
MIKVIGVRFRGGGKVYYFDPNGVDFKREDQVIVETVRGVEIGTVLLVDKEISDDEVPGPIKKIIRKATSDDVKKAEKNIEKEKEAMKICEEKIAKRELEMKLVGRLRTLVNCQTGGFIVGNTGGVIPAYLGCVGEGLYQLLQDGEGDFVSVVEKSK